MGFVESRFVNVWSQIKQNNMGNFHPPAVVGRVARHNFKWVKI